MLFVIHGPTTWRNMEMGEKKVGGKGGPFMCRYLEFIYIESVISIDWHWHWQTESHLVEDLWTRNCLRPPPITLPHTTHKQLPTGGGGGDPTTRVEPGTKPVSEGRGQRGGDGGAAVHSYRPQPCAWVNPSCFHGPPHLSETGLVPASTLVVGSPPPPPPPVGNFFS